MNPTELQKADAVAEIAARWAEITMTNPGFDRDAKYAAGVALAEARRKKWVLQGGRPYWR